MDRSMQSTPQSTPQSTRQVRFAGWMLGIVAVLEIVAMAHHPTVAAPDVEGTLRQIGRLAPLSAIVHGALMAMMLATLYALSEFAIQRGATRPLVRAGGIAYTAGVFVMLGAALVSGFVLPDVAASARHDTAADPQIVRQMLVFCGIVNQACARFGTVAMSVGIGLWSIDLLRGRRFEQAIGVAGCLACVVPVVALVAGAWRLDVEGMSRVVLIDAGWSLAIAAWLVGRARHT